MATYKWVKNDSGYEASDGRATIIARRVPASSFRHPVTNKLWMKPGSKRRWFLVLRDGREFDLGAKASFNTAERVMTREGAK